MKYTLILTITLLVLSLSAGAQVGVGVKSGTTQKQNKQQVESYQHQYYVYNDAGKKVKLRIVAQTDDDGNELVPFQEKEITLSRKDTIYLGNFMSGLANVRPQDVFHIFVVKRRWLFFKKKYEPYFNVSRKKIGTDAVNYHIKIMGVKPKTNKFDE